MFLHCAHGHSAAGTPASWFRPRHCSASVGTTTIDTIDTNVALRLTKTIPDAGALKLGLNISVLMVQKV